MHELTAAAAVGLGKASGHRVHRPQVRLHLGEAAVRLGDGRDRRDRGDGQRRGRESESA